MSNKTPEIHVKQLQKGQETRWDAYVQKASPFAVYHLTAWKRVIENTFGHPVFYLYASHNDDIIGVFPLVFLKSVLFGKFLVSLPYFNYGGILADDDAIRRKLLEEAISIARREGAAHIEMRHLHNYPFDLPTKTSKVLMVLDLPATTEELWNSFKSKLRSQIRRPEKEEFTVRIGHLDEVNNFYQVFAHKMRELGTPVYTKKLFINILQEFPEAVRICTVSDGAKPIASGLILGFQHMLQIPWAATLRAYDRFSVNMMLYWNILKFACEHGYTQFDFGRSTQDEGTYKFKQQWGSEPVPCYWQYWLAYSGDPPEINPDNPKYRLAINVWQRLPLAVTNFLGPHIVKYIP
ncbi:hypothetical protein U27_00659 [Candidatus Vecturithrix granuli]|uniref:BioF2-like acetyltransferase domain-containing protein n=1 Tax=Vecturithrix granuli TaxID=1499967 RepID=A0A081C856_VECG1|nr:hypothetical protein U27_00659 [Candidatus Vecturithrix granuli]